MTPKQKKKVPPNAFSFYVNLYCSKESSKGATKYSSNIAQATKSWLSLSESEKEQVELKFMECKQKYKLQILSQLTNAEPFMKMKKSSVNDGKKSEARVEDLPPNRQDDEIKDFGSVIESEKSQPMQICEQLRRDSEETLVIPMELQNYDDNEQESIREATSTNTKSRAQPTLIEPLPPSVKNGRDLFCMLSSADLTNNVSWSSLPQLEKNQYSRAVSLMKKDYIFRYKEYLESLTPKQLFDHYNKVIS